MAASHPRIQLRDYFAGIAEYAFQTQVGIADPPLIDYISDLLIRFIRADILYSVRDLRGRRLGDMATLCAEAEARVGDARREIHRHIGDFALFWTGVYPEALGHTPQQSSEANVRFVDFCTHGKRAYHIAATTPAESQEVRSEVLERLSNEFELCAFGLGEARKEWERRDREGGGQLMVFN